MRISSLSLAILLPVLTQGADTTSNGVVLRGLAPVVAVNNTVPANATTAATTTPAGLVCNASSLAIADWKGDLYRDCVSKNAAAVGALTTGDTTSQGLSEFCTKCGTGFDTRASTWRDGCKKSKTAAASGWVKDTDRKLKKYATGLDAFGCTKTTGGDFCAKLYADGLKQDFALPTACPFFKSCCFGLYTQWADVNTTLLTSVTNACPGSADAVKLLKC